ncbi:MULTISPECIES: class I SAM-dependent methyltransferase [unclassified Microbacterium]|uniref:class I SAM-dependent methyltransferase n=1 Tax=unclassified Microbacterium TaxID=2609290 RepID=UPI0012FB4E13|nr:methyltransferase domain-containing protein [Microbacterium sp. MAH-37]MVQ43152.1 methyltransferase domain-containing protein [Microbacterium sp. MAH-37]
MAEALSPGAASGAASLRRSAGSRRDAADSSEISQISDALAAIRDAFDARAPVYDESRMHRELADAVATFAASTGATTVIDVATGTGLVLRALRAQLPGARLIGADISPGMLAVARGALPEAEWIEADAVALPLPDASADLITCVTALHVIPDVPGAVQEWRRILSSRGRLITATFAHPGRARPAGRVNPYPVDHSPFQSREALAATFAELGFSPRRHTVWSDGDETVLIAELAPAR